MEATMLAEDSTDIFPKYVSKVFEPLAYPSSFTLMGNDEKFKPFIAHVKNQLMYYKREESAIKYLRHLSDFDKAATTIDRFRPAEINWKRVYRRYTVQLNESFRTNVDVKAGFKIGDKFLVKSFFTFGQRTVQPNTVHVYQILEVPLVLFVKGHNKICVKDRLFPIDDYHKYDQMILPPNGTYYIPDGTTYFIMALQKMFFSLNVYDLSEFEIPPHFIDPVKAKVRKLKGMYECPVETPFIDDLDEEKQQHVPEFNENDLLREFFVEPPVVFQEEKKSSPPIRRIQYVQSPDFVKYFQSTVRRTYDDPNYFYCFENQRVAAADDEEPMDLTITKSSIPEENLNNSETTPNDEQTPCLDNSETTPKTPCPDNSETTPKTPCPEVIQSFDFFDLDQIIFDEKKSDEICKMEEELMAASPFFI